MGKESWEVHEDKIVRGKTIYQFEKLAKREFQSLLEELVNEAVAWYRSLTKT